MVLQTFVLFSLAFSNRCLYNTNMTTSIVNENYTTQEKLQILADAAKYDVACTSSGSSRRGTQMYHTPIEEAYITRQLIHVDTKDLWKMQHANETYSQMTLADFGIG